MDFMTKQITKTSLFAKARELIDRQAVDVEFSKEDTALMNEILGTAFDSFCKKKNPLWPSDPRHVHACFSELWRDFSWRKVIEQPSAEALVKKALRESVAHDMRDALYAIEPRECAVRGRIPECKVDDDLTLDHLDEPFSTIATEWMALRGTPDLKDPPHGQGRMIADADVEADWIAFHASRATYQILCRSCNAIKGARGNAYLMSRIREADCAEQ